MLSTVSTAFEEEERFVLAQESPATMPRPLRLLSQAPLAWGWTQAGLHFSQFQRLEFKIKVPAGLVSGENPLPGSRPSGFPAPGAAWGGGGPGPAWHPAPLRLRHCPTPGRAPCHEGQCVCAVLPQARSVLSAAQGRAQLPSCCPVSPCRLNGCKLFGHLSRSLV